MSSFVGVALLALFAAACGPSVPVGDAGGGSGSATDASKAAGSTSEDTAAETSTGALDHASCDGVFDMVSECFPADGAGGVATLPTDCSCCPMERLCPLVFMDCSREQDPQGCLWWRDGVVQERAAARCALEVLRDGTVGLVQIEGAQIDGSGARNLWVFDRETVVVLEVDVGEGSSGRIDYVAAASSAAYFDDCLTQTDAEALTACLFDGLQGRGDETELSCPAG